MSLARKDYSSLKLEIRREADRLNKQAERAAKNYGTNSPVYKEIERNIVGLVQSTGTYTQPYYRSATGALKISLSEKNIDTLTKTSIAKNTYVRSQISHSKTVNITNLISKYQTEIEKATGQQYFVTNFRERREIVKKYIEIQTISESNLWNIFGSEMGNAKKAGNDKLVLTLLFDIQNAVGNQLDINNIGKVFELWRRGTDVRKLSDTDLEMIKNAEKAKDEEYVNFIRD